MHIRESIKSLSEDQKAAAMQLFGIDMDGSSETDSSGEHDDGLLQDTSEKNPFDYDEVVSILRENQFNWFELVNVIVEKISPNDDKAVVNKLSQYFPKVLEICHTSHEKTLLQQSYQAFLNYYNTHQLEADRKANALNGFIVADSESEDPDQYIGLNDTSSERAKAIIAKKRKAIQRRAQYLISKSIANQNFLKRKQSAHTKIIIKEFPTIGKEIEDFVQSCNIGADAWRRTGVLTFDGNVRVKSKVTYTRIAEYVNI